MAARLRAVRLAQNRRRNLGSQPTRSIRGKTPLHARLKATGRLIAESVGDQFVFTTVVSVGMSRPERHAGYRSLLRRLYSYRAYRRRAMDFILNRASLLGSRVLARRDDLAVVGRIGWSGILRPSPRRTWLTLSMALETASRRAEAIRQASTPALVHKHFYEYVAGDIPRYVASGPEQSGSRPIISHGRPSESSLLLDLAGEHAALKPDLTGLHSQLAGG